MIGKGQPRLHHWRERVIEAADRRFDQLALAPLVTLLIAIAIIPFLTTVALSVTDFSFNLPGHNGSFTALSNYTRALFHDERFIASVKLQGLFLAATVPLECALGLVVAFAVRREGALARWATPALAFPMLLAPVTVGMIWRLLLHGDYGLFGFYLSHFHSESGRSILGSPSTAFISIVGIDIWQWTPFFCVIFVASLFSLPEAPFQAAQVDGASVAYITRTITLPLLRPSITVAVLIRVMDSFKEFDKIAVLTHGGPASATELVSVYTWIVSFDHGDLAYGSALTVLIYIVVYFISWMLFWLGRKDWR